MSIPRTKKPRLLFVTALILMIAYIYQAWSIYQDCDRVYAKNKTTKAVYAIGTAGKKLNKQGDKGGILNV